MGQRCPDAGVYYTAANVWYNALKCLPHNLSSLFLLLLVLRGLPVHALPERVGLVSSCVAMDQVNTFWSKGRIEYRRDTYCNRIPRGLDPLVPIINNNMMAVEFLPCPVALRQTICLDCYMQVHKAVGLRCLKGLLSVLTRDATRWQELHAVPHSCIGNHSFLGANPFSILQCYSYGPSILYQDCLHMRLAYESSTILFQTTNKRANDRCCSAHRVVNCRPRQRSLPKHKGHLRSNCPPGRLARKHETLEIDEILHECVTNFRLHECPKRTLNCARHWAHLSQTLQVSAESEDRTQVIA
mmetsp:Transcript_7299/g.26876  ORF Transcript_7299/g.26876 Transcript_7299/m.26876 type:complete len:299 (+) Transcript_7299:456-1352(+)